MPKCETIINKNIDFVYERLVNKFMTDMKITNLNDLEEATITIETPGTFNQSVKVQQTLSTDKANYKITLKNSTKKVISNVTYQLERINADQTKMTYSEFAEGAKSGITTLNFLMFELPILSSGTKKKINVKLARIKQYVEAQWWLYSMQTILDYVNQ